MGNLRKFKKSIKKSYDKQPTSSNSKPSQFAPDKSASSSSKITNPAVLSKHEDVILEDSIILLYSTHLRRKDVEKAKSIISLANINKDDFVLNSIVSFNKKMATKLGIDFIALSSVQKLSLFIDNPEYLTKLYDYLNNPKLNNDFDLDDFDDDFDDDDFDDASLNHNQELQEPTLPSLVDTYINNYFIINSLSLDLTKRVKTIISKYL